jgi:hypothetical protein
MSKSDLLDSLKTQFDPTKFIITKKENTFYVKSIENSKFCSAITINYDAQQIEIDSLDKCSISGGEILKKIEKFAKSVGIHKLTLGDISELDLGCIKLDLAIFYILHSNRSWYNSKGYFSHYFKVEQRSNKKLLKEPIDNFLEQCFKMSDEDHKLTDNIDKLLDGIQHFWNSDKKIKTIKFFNIAKESMRKEDICDPKNKDKYEWLEYAVDIVSRSGKITYNNNLSKLLINSPTSSSIPTYVSDKSPSVGGKKTKKRKSKSKSRSRKTK